MRTLGVCPDDSSGENSVANIVFASDDGAGGSNDNVFSAGDEYAFMFPPADGVFAR